MVDLERLAKAMGDLNEKLTLQMLNEFVASNPSEKEVQEVVGACQKGLRIVGELFENRTYFIGDLIFSGELMNSTMDLLGPFISKNSKGKIGTIVLGTVKGDLHDIGKNIFKAMAEASGFEVYDLGIDQPASAFVKKVKEVKSDIVGMSALLTLALDAMKDTVEAFKAAGLRDQVKLIAGGSCVTTEFCEQAGIDAFGGSAANGLKICLGWVKSECLSRLQIYKKTF